MFQIFQPFSVFRPFSTRPVRPSLPAPAFYAPLLSDLTLAKGTGPLSFSRASTASVVDWEGITRTVLAHEARFAGARRVENIVPSSINHDDWWIWEAAKAVVLDSVELTTTDAWGTLGHSIAGSYSPGDTLEFTVDVKQSNSSYILLKFVSTSLGDISQAKFDLLPSGSHQIEWTAGPKYLDSSITPLEDGWFRIGVVISDIPSDSSDVIMQPLTATSGSETSLSVFVKNVQVEVITGQASYFTDDRVSKGVLASPWYGANVDGVRYFATENDGTPLTDVGYYTAASDADELTAPLANISNTAGTIYLEADLSDWATGELIAGMLAPSATTGATADDGTNTASGPSVTPSGWVKIAMRYGSSKMRIAVNGSLGTEADFDGDWNLSQFSLGNGVTGKIRNVKTWVNALSDKNLEKITS